MATIPTISSVVTDDHIVTTINSNAGDNHVKFEKRYAGEDWILLSDDIPVGTGQTYSDYNVAHNQTADYRATAVDGSGGEAVSLIASATQVLTGPTIHQAVRLTHTNKNGAALEINAQESVNRNSEREETVQDLPGLVNPVIDVGTLVAKKWDIPFISQDADEISLIRAWRDNRAVLRIRNGIQGDAIFAVLPEDAIVEELVARGTLSFYQTDYREGIA